MPIATRLSHLLLHHACQQRGIPCPAATEFKDLVHALSDAESQQLARAALAALQGTENLFVLASSASAARLYTDARLHALCEPRPRAVHLYRAMLADPKWDLAMLLYQAHDAKDPSALALLLAGIAKVAGTLASPAPYPCDARLSVTTSVQSATQRVPLPALVPKTGPAPKRSAVAASEKLALTEQPKFHVWRTQSALTVEWASAATTPVLFVQTASKLPGGGYDWSQRISLAIAPHEAFQMLQVCLGTQNEALIKFHGDSRNKSCDLTRNTDTGRKEFELLVRLREAQRSHLVGLSAFDVLSLTRLLSLSVASNLPGVCTPEQALALVAAKSRGS
jgi:hypothetical protein